MMQVMKSDVESIVPSTNYIALNRDGLFFDSYWDYSTKIIKEVLRVPYSIWTV